MQGKAQIELLVKRFKRFNRVCNQKSRVGKIYAEGYLRVLRARIGALRASRGSQLFAIVGIPGQFGVGEAETLIFSGIVLRAINKYYPLAHARDMPVKGVFKGLRQGEYLLVGERCILVEQLYLPQALFRISAAPIERCEQMCERDHPYLASAPRFGVQAHNARLVGACNKIVAVFIQPLFALFKAYSPLNLAPYKAKCALYLRDRFAVWDTHARLIPHGHGLGE